MDSVSGLVDCNLPCLLVLRRNHFWGPSMACPRAATNHRTPAASHSRSDNSSVPPPRRLAPALAVFRNQVNRQGIITLCLLLDTIHGLCNIHTVRRRNCEVENLCNRSLRPLNPGTTEGSNAGCVTNRLLLPGPPTLTGLTFISVGVTPAWFYDDCSRVRGRHQERMLAYSEIKRSQKSRFFLFDTSQAGRGTPSTLRTS